MLHFNLCGKGKALPSHQFSRPSLRRALCLECRTRMCAKIRDVLDV